MKSSTGGNLSRLLSHLRTLTADATSQLDVLGHDRYALGVDSAVVGVLEKTNQVRFRCLLQS
jgi:hypothetical protein